MVARQLQSQMCPEQCAENARAVEVVNAFGVTFLVAGGGEILHQRQPSRVVELSRLGQLLFCIERLQQFEGKIFAAVNIDVLRNDFPCFVIKHLRELWCFL